ncbi:MAG: HU family DNA-binding protein [Bacteroidaceae bacterium]|nr:HU family DNA-binding protein [Bacteroidaceae bacterium]
MITYKITKRRNPKDDSVRYHATSMTATSVDFDRIVADVAARSTMSIGDIAGVLHEMQEVIIQHLKDGNAVRLGILGSFRTSIGSAGAPTAEEVTANLIRRAKVVFTPSPKIKRRMSVSELKFQLYDPKRVNALSKDVNNTP